MTILDDFLAAAKSACGYRALPGLGSTYGFVTGNPGEPWDGAFIEVTAREVGLEIPAVSTTVALAHFSRAGRLHRKPKVGDIVFFTFSANGPFGQPHAGIVLDCSQWRSHGKLTTVEAQVSTPSSRERDGVARRTRYTSDVLGFGRPKFRVSRGDAAAASAVVSVHGIRNGDRGQIEVLQTALGTVTPLTGAARGVLDNQTRSAYADYQRQTGTLNTGHLDTDTLKRLAEQTGLFSVKE